MERDTETDGERYRETERDKGRYRGIERRSGEKERHPSCHTSTEQSV